MKQAGRVYLVGAGPGDPDLLTLKAARLLRQADVVVYDRLVAAEILALVPPGAARINAGKANGRHTMTQDAINELLLRLAESGRQVVRLKGGDPFIFGRGSEEADYLARHGVACEVVPGITAAAGCAAELGIPLTHRGLANGVRFVTGHCHGGALDLNWQSLADPDTTLVVYMGLANLAEIGEQLIAAGLAPGTPALAVANGTTPRRMVCRGTLADLASKAAAAGLPSPALIVIGRVVSLAEQASVEAEDVMTAMCSYA
jgi:uroporphyrin-III C-methyltransferase/precorrin-2 dehydrogenase/sirohydrochlorin ferrochelatase/uroporphyrin-III C-methyltransferase